MEYRCKQLEEELSGLSKLLADLGARLSEAGREVTASAVLPSETLLEHILVTRGSFESARTKVHGHAVAMLVSPLPKPEDLKSIAAIGSLLRAAAAAEEKKHSVEGEREQALKALARALTLAHREVPEFKPLQESQAKLAELRKAISNVTWPQRHPDSEALANSIHPANALLHFVENLDTIEDEQWMALEATISGAYGKPLFVAASRGKLEIRGESRPEPEAKAVVEPKTVKVEPVKVEPIKVEPVKVETAKVEAKPPEPVKPAAAAEKPVEKPVVTPAAVSPAAGAPAVAPAPKKVPTPVASAATPPVAHAVVPVADKKEAAPEKAAEKPSLPQPVSVSPTPDPAPRAVIAEKKEAADKPVPMHAPSPVPHLPVAPPLETPPAPPRVAPAVAGSTPAPTPVTPPIPAAPPASATLNSLSALATATEPAVEKKPAVMSQTVSKTEPSPTNGEAAGEEQKTGEGDGQRPQRWGFWRGNR